MKESLRLRTVKEAIRRFCSRTGLASAISPFRSAPTAHLRHETLADRFNAIYKDRVWTLGRADVPLSGTGSTLEATAVVRAELPLLMRRIGASELLDVGCGDFTWMNAVNLTGIDYIGIDIVPSVVSANQAAFGDVKRQFLERDALADDLPDAPVVLLREVLFHLSFADVWGVLSNVLRLPRQWLLITSDRATALNADIISGDFRMLNLSKRPFRFPEPPLFISEEESWPGRRLCAWPADVVGRCIPRQLGSDRT